MSKKAMIWLIGLFIAVSTISAPLTYARRQEVDVRVVDSSIKGREKHLTCAEILIGKWGWPEEKYEYAGHTDNGKLEIRGFPFNGSTTYCMYIYYGGKCYSSCFETNRQGSARANVDLATADVIR